MTAVTSFAIDRFTQPVRRALRNDFVRHSALVFAASMAANVLNYVFNFAISRRVGVEGFATLSSLVSFLMLLSIPTSIVTLVVVKYAAIYHSTGDHARVRRLSQVLLRWTTAAAVALFCVGTIFLPQIAAFLHINENGSILLCLGVVALGLITPSARGILQGEQDFLRYGISTVLEALLKVVLAIAFVYTGHGVTGAMFGWLIGTFCAVLYTTFAVLVKHDAHAVKPVRLQLNVRRLLNTTFGVGLAAGFITFMSFMDVLLVKHYFPTHEAGLYAAVNLSGKVVFFIVGFVPAVVLPKAIARSANGEIPTTLLVHAITLTLTLSGAVLLFFGAFPVTAIRLLAGRDFVSAAPYVLQYDAAMCLLGLLALFVNYNIGVHRFRFLYFLSVVLLSEVTLVVVLHHTLWDVIHILLVGNFVGIICCCFDAFNFKLNNSRVN